MNTIQWFRDNPDEVGKGDLLDIVEAQSVDYRLRLVLAILPKRLLKEKP